MTAEEVKKKMDFIGGAFLDSKALPESGIEVTIKSLKKEKIQNMRTFKDEEKWVLFFEELSHGMVLGAKCNRKNLMGKLGPAAGWAGKKIKIYQDPKVKFGRDTVGAIRIK